MGSKHTNSSAWQGTSDYQSRMDGLDLTDEQQLLRDIFEDLSGETESSRSYYDAEVQQALASFFEENPTVAPASETEGSGTVDVADAGEQPATTPSTSTPASSEQTALDGFIQQGEDDTSLTTDPTHDQRPERPASDPANASWATLNTDEQNERLAARGLLEQIDRAEPPAQPSRGTTTRTAAGDSASWQDSPLATQRTSLDEQPASPTGQAHLNDEAIDAVADSADAATLETADLYDRLWERTPTRETGATPLDEYEPSSVAEQMGQYQPLSLTEQAGPATLDEDGFEVAPDDPTLVPSHTRLFEAGERNQSEQRARTGERVQIGTYPIPDEPAAATGWETLSDEQAGDAATLATSEVGSVAFEDPTTGTALGGAASQEQSWGFVVEGTATQTVEESLGRAHEDARHRAPFQERLATAVDGATDPAQARYTERQAIETEQTRRTNHHRTTLATGESQPDPLTRVADEHPSTANEVTTAATALAEDYSFVTEDVASTYLAEDVLAGRLDPETFDGTDVPEQAIDPLVRTELDRSTAQTPPTEYPQTLPVENTDNAGSANSEQPAVNATVKIQHVETLASETRTHQVAYVRNPIQNVTATDDPAVTRDIKLTLFKNSYQYRDPPVLAEGDKLTIKDAKLGRYVNTNGGEQFTLTATGETDITIAEEGSGPAHTSERDGAFTPVTRTEAGEIISDTTEAAATPQSREALQSHHDILRKQVDDLVRAQKTHTETYDSVAAQLAQANVPQSTPYEGTVAVEGSTEAMLTTYRDHQTKRIQQFSTATLDERIQTLEDQLEVYQHTYNASSPDAVLREQATADGELTADVNSLNEWADTQVELRRYEHARQRHAERASETESS
jgi:hypothetical protein